MRMATAASVDVTRSGGRLAVEVVDDGVGGADTERGSGLRGLADRVEALGGRLRIWSPRGRRNARAGGDSVRVAIAEDSLLLREGLARLLDRLRVRGRRSVRGRGRAAPAACGATSRTSPSWTSGCRPRTATRACARRSRSAKSYPSVGVLVLSQYVELGLALKLLSGSAEGVGYLLKDRISDVKDFLAAIRRVAAGGSALDPIIVSTLVARQRPRRSARAA